MKPTAKLIIQFGITPNQISISGFLIGLLVIPALWYQMYWLALVIILLNRIFDGLDGTVARLTQQTDTGAFLDIVLDFIFYAAVVWGFALADPIHNALPASTLAFSFMGTGSSFLAFAVMAAKRNIKSIDYPQKSLYYIGGLAEGTETITFFAACCILPLYFPIMAYGFSLICCLTTITRIIGGYVTLKKSSSIDDTDTPSQ